MKTDLISFKLLKTGCNITDHSRNADNISIMQLKPVTGFDIL